MAVQSQFNKSAGSFYINAKAPLCKLYVSNSASQFFPLTISQLDIKKSLVLFWHERLKILSIMTLYVRVKHNWYSSDNKNPLHRDFMNWWYPGGNKRSTCLSTTWSTALKGMREETGHVQQTQHRVGWLCLAWRKEEFHSRCFLLFTKLREIST